MSLINSINSTFPPAPPPCRVATTAAFSSVTYVNADATHIGSLTNAGTQAALSIDGVSVAAGDRVLVKNQASGFQNGIYVVNDIGSGATNWVLFRSSDYSVPSSIYPGQLIFITAGTVNANSLWQQTAVGPFTMGTTAITFAAYAGQSTITTLGTITTGVWNGTAITVANGGTGNTTFTAYSVICAGTTSTGVFQNVSGVGSSGQVLTSNGASALPTWQAAGAGTVTSVSGTASRITSTGGATPVIDISASYVGQSSITTLGTITTGVWNGTAITVANGGTGNTTFTAYSVICAGTTATGVFQNVSGLGTSGQFLTSNGAGALPTWQTGGALPTGTVKQVVAGNLTSSFTSTSTTLTDSGLTVSVTPGSSSNKVLVHWSVALCSSAVNNGGFCSLVRGSTNIFIGDAAGSRQQMTGASYDASTTSYHVVSGSYLDSPATTSATTYKIQVCNSGAGTVYVNRNEVDTATSVTARSTSSIIVLEIVG